MKAITLVQPYASLIIDKRKRIETRSWLTHYRGEIAIHAGAKVNREDCLRFGYDPDTIPRTAVLGIANLTDCVQFPHPDAPLDEYGNFEEGRYGFLLADVREFARLVAAKGKLGLWHWHRRPPALSKDRHNAAVKAWKTRRAKATRH